MSSAEVPASWRVVELDELRAPGDHTFVGGPFGSDLTRGDYVEEAGVPVIRGTNLGGDTGFFIDSSFVFVSEQKAKSLSRNLAFPGDLVFTQRGTLGQVVVIPKDAQFPKYVISQSQMKLSPDAKRVDAQFLYQYFRLPSTVERLLSRTQSTGVPHINLGILKRFPVILPPLPEQLRLAAILDQAESLRVKRRQALERLEVFARFLFLEVFGDPATNAKGWPRRPLGELTAKFSDGPFGSNLKSVHYRPAGIRVVRLQNIGVGEFLNDDSAFIDPSHFAILGRHECLSGDVLIATLGDPNLRACIQPAWLPIALNKADCVQARPDPRIANAEYLCALLNQPSTEQLAQSLVLGQTRLRISMGRLRGLSVPVPPIGLQRKFAEQMVVFEKLKSSHRASLAKLDALFASLQHRAFRGEL